MSRRPRPVLARPAPIQAPPAPVALGALGVLLVLFTAGCGGPSPSPSGLAGGGGADGDPVVVSMLDGNLARLEPDPDDAGDGRAVAAVSGGEPLAGAAEGSGPVRTGAQVLIGGGSVDLSGLRVGLIANRASTVGAERTIDVLHRDPTVDLVMLFAPEHGVAADGGAGSPVADGIDPATGLVVHSLYGANRSPSAASLAQLDVVVYDLQDVGARFYTYPTTMGLAMQAAARAGVPFVVLDRPDPLGGDRPDGPVRDGANESFVGPYPVPALYGLTAGELARAIKGEGWLDDVDDLDLRVVEMEGWLRRHRWEDTGLGWVAPSPGLPTAETTLVYPATVLAEATTLSYGQGTDHPFAQVGAPWLDAEAVAQGLNDVGLAGVDFEAVRFTPEPDPSGAVRFAGQSLPGVRLVVTDRAAIRPMAVAVHLLDRVLRDAGDEPVIDQPDFFDRLAGRASLRQDLLAGRPPSEIVASWEADLAAWNELIAPYRLYGADD